jgi:2-aminoadipate transaminase
MPPAPLALSSRSGRTTDSPINRLIRLALENPSLVSLAAGLVDEESLPAEAVAEAAAEVLSVPAAGRAALQYGTVSGHPPLREQVLARFAAADGLRPADLRLTPEEVVVTTGSQQLLALLGDILLDPGDIVLTEAPTYFVFQGVLRGVGARVLSVPMDEHGLDVDALESLLRRLERSGELPRVKLIYTCDYYQNPTGLTLSRERRPRLLELARRYSKTNRIIILEDGAYRELRYEGDDLPSVKSFDTRNEHVVWTSTFSKPLAPGLKTGCGILPRELVGPLLRLKGDHDFGSNNLTQHLLDRLLASRAYDAHVARLRQVYRAKRDAMLGALEEEFRDPPHIMWTRPAGGLYVWATFPAGMESGPSSRLLRAALDEGVLYVPGEYGYSPDGGPAPRNTARLSFGEATPGQIREGVRRLRRAVLAASGPAPRNGAGGATRACALAK